MPVPETCAPAAWVNLSGAATVTVAVPLAPVPKPPLVMEAITAVSRSAPLPTVMVWPTAKPSPPGDRDDGPPRGGGGTTGGGARRANRRDDGCVGIRAGIDHDGLS